LYTATQRWKPTSQHHHHRDPALHRVGEFDHALSCALKLMDVQVTRVKSLNAQGRTMDDDGAEDSGDEDLLGGAAVYTLNPV
jgi:hypothetical protein